MTGNARVRERLDLREHRGAALELDRVGATLLHEACGRLERLGRRGLVRAERQVGDDHRARGAAHDGAHERDELVDGDRQGRVVAVDDHGGGVADEDGGDAGLVEDARGHGVVGRDHRPLLAADGCLGQVAHRDAPALGHAVEGHLLLRSRGSPRSPRTRQ